MALWRAGPERAYVALPAPHNPRERVTRIYREGEIFPLPDEGPYSIPSRTWYPKDDAARAICTKLAASFLKKEPEIEDPDEPKQVAKHQRLYARWTVEQIKRATWFGPDPYDDAMQTDPMAPVTLTEMARSAGKSVRVSDQPT